MLRNAVRTLGLACILAGTILYFIQTEDATKVSGATDQDLQGELTALKTKLAETQKELADIQTASSVAESKVVEAEDSHEDELETETLVKSVFSILPGTDSSTVAHSLVRSGILEDSAEFEIYLVANELTGYIQIGEYNLDSSMDIETIAKIITKVK